jgi:hypothetical protein
VVYTRLPFFLKTPDIIFSVMQKPFKKCVFPMRVNRFLHIRKKLIRRFQKKTAVYSNYLLVTSQIINQTSFVSTFNQVSTVFHRKQLSQFYSNSTVSHEGCILKVNKMRLKLKVDSFSIVETLNFNLILMTFWIRNKLTVLFSGKHGTLAQTY